MSVQLSHAARRALLDAARRALRDALWGRKADLSLAAPHDELMEPAGCFVSLHDRSTHALRGCIGRLDATHSLIQAVRETAAGVLDDPRFVDNPVTAGELPRLEIEISVVWALRAIDGPECFDLLNDGIYLTHGQRHGCFLPQVARETGWTREQLLGRLCTEKLGLAPTAWQDPAMRYMAFPVTVLGPEPFETGDDQA
jgi:AmmeMemoRadiSam system protein A